MPEGEGFAGQYGRAGYMLLYSILFRPSLLVISLFMCIIVMQVSGALLGPLLSPLVDSMVALGSTGIAGAVFLFSAADLEDLRRNG